MADVRGSLIKIEIDDVHPVAGDVAVDQCYPLRNEVEEENEKEKYERKITISEPAEYKCHINEEEVLDGEEIVTGVLSDSADHHRAEKSLGLLTTKFVHLLQEAQDGVLDLKQVLIYI